jgi:hypothetical protein
MNNLMDVLPTLKSPLCESLGGKGLTGSVVSRASLTASDRDRMYDLLFKYFAGTARDRFEADLQEKESVVLLRDVRGRIEGFSTYMRIEIPIDGQDIVAFFSGDTIVAREYWGETILSRLWSQTVFAEADRIVAERPTAQVYWFLICSGYKTFRFLPVFFREFYPHPAATTPPHIRGILHSLGQRKFGPHYDSTSGIVRLPHASALRHGVADLTEHRLRDPLVAFFTAVNPRHAEGEELACLTRISRTNLTRAGDRMVRP